MSICTAEINRYHRLNQAARSGCAVFFGSGLFAGIPAGELARDLGPDTPVYNRSIAGLSIKEAEEALSECVCPLSPSKVFINLGETDLEQADFDAAAFLSAYEWLLYTLNSRLKGKSQLYLVSVLSARPMAAAVNEGLRRLAEETGCIYIDVTRAALSGHPEIRIFELIRPFLRDHMISFSDAFEISRTAVN